MPQGTVKLLVIDRGYGFLTRAEGEDVFFHHSAVPGHGFKQLAVGQAVTFELAGGAGKSAKGPRAKVVTVGTAENVEAASVDTSGKPDG